MKLLIRFSVVMLVFISASTFAQNDMSRLKSTFQQMGDKWGQAFTSGDVNTLVNFYTDDAVSMPPNQPIRNGKDAIRTATDKDNKDGYKFTNFKTNTIDVWGSGNVAVEQGTYSLNILPPNTTTQIADNGKYINVWQKQSDGTWKIKTEIWNSDINPMKQQAGAKEDINK